MIPASPEANMLVLNIISPQGKHPHWIFSCAKGSVIVSLFLFLSSSLTFAYVFMLPAYKECILLLLLFWCIVNFYRTDIFSLSFGTCVDFFHHRDIHNLFIWPGVLKSKQQKWLTNLSQNYFTDFIYCLENHPKESRDLLGNRKQRKATKPELRKIIVQNILSKKPSWLPTNTASTYTGGYPAISAKRMLLLYCGY